MITHTLKEPSIIIHEWAFWFILVAAVNSIIIVQTPYVTNIDILSAALISGVEAFVAYMLVAQLPLKPVYSLLFIALIITHPVTILALEHARGIEILYYLLLSQTLFLLMRYGDVRSVINVGCCLAMAPFINPLLNVVAISFLPFLFYLAPPQLKGRKYIYFLLLVVFPLLAVMAYLKYMISFFPELSESPFFPGSMSNFKFFAKDITQVMLSVIWALVMFPLGFVASVKLKSEKLISTPLLIAWILPIITFVLMDGSFGTIITLLVAPTIIAMVQLLSRGFTKLALSFHVMGWLSAAILFVYKVLPVDVDNIFFVRWFA